MKKIVIMSRGEGTDEAFVQLVETLFPECEVCVVLSDQDASVVPRKEREVMTGRVPLADRKSLFRKRPCSSINFFVARKKT
ncbi:MAG: hypothetical protein JRJ42_11800 [Deltaproteobacteria bacterium]|nr:hypothetical protein [Deltaproteobacteria bacterium]MBW1967801.1 hypothetical protein [Deltaproteobacteria bacterium]MBW2098995.1 hypothetical protein [Deltaproteobacteria bacterium]